MVKTPVSPKVTYAGLVGVIVAAALSIAQQAVGNQEFLDALPLWLRPLAPSLIAALAAVVTAYLKRDPLRDAGAREQGGAGQMGDGYDDALPDDGDCDVEPVESLRGEIR